MKALLVLVSVLLGSSLVAADAARFEELPVFTSGQEGYNTFRIPAIVRANNGVLLAFAEGRLNNRRDHDDVDLVLKRSTDNGATWAPLQVIWGKDDSGVITWGNPCPVVDRSNGRVWLLCNWENYKVYSLYSDDQGATWSKPRDITAEAWNPAWPRPPEPTLTSWTGPGIGIQLERGPHAGRLVIPMHLRRHPLKDAAQNEACSFYSDDHGATWKYSENTSGVGNEAQVVELSDGRLQLNQRNQSARPRLISYSKDGGATWSPSEPDAHLAGPAVQGSILRFSWADAAKKEKNVMLYAMPAGPKREAMTVHASFDDGVTWPAHRQLREGFSAYSSLVRQADGRVGLLYETEDYKFIRYARFDSEWIQAGGASNAPAQK